MEEKSPEESQGEQPQESPKKSSGRIFLIIGLAVVVLAGTGGFLFLRRAKAATPRPAESAADGPVEIKGVLHLETFTVNMNDPEQKIYLRIGIDLGMGKALKGEGNASASTAPLRDTILSVLTACKPEEVTTAEGKAQLKQRLLDALQQRAPEMDIREVYFTEFLIQR